MKPAARMKTNLSGFRRHIRHGISTIWIPGVVIVVGALILFAIPTTRENILRPVGGNDSTDFPDFITDLAKRGPFRIVVTEHGQLDSMQNSTLSNSVEGATTIIAIVPEGTNVKAPVKSRLAGVVSLDTEESGAMRVVTVTGDDGTAVDHDVVLGEYTEVVVRDGDVVREGDYLGGDIVCDLDSSTLVDEERQQQIVATQARAEVEKGEKNVEIQVTTNKSTLAAARLSEKLAHLDLDKYTAEGGEYDQELKRIGGELKQIEEDLAVAQETLQFTRRVVRRGYKGQNDLEAARIGVMKQEILLGVKKGELKVLEEFTRERTIAELDQLAKDTTFEIKRVELEGEAALAQFTAELDARRLTWEVEMEKLVRLQRQIKACRLIAPQDGKVVYAMQRSRRSEPIVIEEGASVRERQAIINLPDLTQMKVKARIHESKISRVRPGLKVEIDVDALPGIPLYGSLTTVASVPIPGRWPNFDLKEYEAEIEITNDTDGVSQLKPGMTAEIRIIVQQRNADVLQVPVQAAVSIGPKYVVYVLTRHGPERREVRFGDTNDEMMEILDGVQEGERVIMNPRTHFSDEIGELEQQLAVPLLNIHSMMVPRCLLPLR